MSHQDGIGSASASFQSHYVHSENGQGPRSTYGPEPARHKFVLCFDGTGNKFQGNGSDSNSMEIIDSIVSGTILNRSSLENLFNAR